MSKPEPMLWLSDARGVYIPRDFVNSFANWANVSGISDEDKAALQAGPDHEWYWEAWMTAIDHAKVTDDKGNTFFIHQDGDCWLVPEGMEWDEANEFYRWPDEDTE